jgi:hypothetical protein
MSFRHGAILKRFYNEHGTPWRSHALCMDETVITPSAKRKRVTDSISLLPAHDGFPCRRRRWTQGRLLLCPMGSWNGHPQCPGSQMLAENGLMDPTPIMQRIQTLRQPFRLCNATGWMANGKVNMRNQWSSEGAVFIFGWGDAWVKKVSFILIEDGMTKKAVSNVLFCEYDNVLWGPLKTENNLTD